MLENSVNSWDTKVFLAGFSLFSWFSEKPANGLLRKKKVEKEGNGKQFYGSVSVLGKCKGGSFVCA